MRVGVKTRSGNSGPVPSRVRCFSGQSERSIAGSSQGDENTGVYTSGALCSDDDFATFDMQHAGAPKGSGVQLDPSPIDQEAQQDGSMSDNNIVSSLGFSSPDYEPLSTLRQSASNSPVIPLLFAEETPSSCPAQQSNEGSLLRGYKPRNPSEPL